MSEHTLWLRHPESSRAVRMRSREGAAFTPMGDSIPQDGIYCAEFPALFTPTEFANSKKTEENEKRQRAFTHWGGYPWAGIGNPVMLAMYVRFTMAMGFWFFVALIIASPFILLWLGALAKGTFGSHLWAMVKLYSLFGAGFFVAWRLMAWLDDRDVFPEGNLAIFQRATGLVKVPLDSKESIELPFDEFIPGISLGSSRGYPRYGLVLIHRHTGHGLSNAGSISGSRERVFLEWEFIRQYMDPTLPIPDMPSLEVIRQDDPVTREWDARYGRPADFWRSMSEDDFFTLTKGSHDPGFPWDDLALGIYPEDWQGSDYSRLPWVAAVREQVAHQAPDLPKGMVQEGDDGPQRTWQNPPPSVRVQQDQRRDALRAIVSQPAPPLTPDGTYRCEFCQGGVMGRYAVTAGELVFCGEVHRDAFLDREGLASPAPEAE